MTRHNITRLVLLIFLIALIGSPVATVGQQDGVRRVEKKKKPGQQPQTQQQPKVSRRQSDGIVPPQKQSSEQRSPQRSPQTELSQSGHGSAKPPLTERVLSRKLGSEGLQQLLGQLEGMKTESWFFDTPRPQTGNDYGFRPSGTKFFTGTFMPITVQDAAANVERYGSQGGGIVLEGTAMGLGAINNVWYDSRFNAFIVDDRAVYFMKVPRKTVAVLCRAIDQDEKERVGVSLSQDRDLAPYGKVPKDSDLAWDLRIADNFLADIVFGWNDWTAGYRFAAGFRPEPEQGGSWHGCVYFVFTASKFEIQREEVRLSEANFKVTLVPLSHNFAKDGGFLPDDDAIRRGRIPQQYERNATHVAQNISYYRQERIIDRMFSYCEVAAFIRALKREDFDLEALANNIPRGK